VLPRGRRGAPRPARYVTGPLGGGDLEVGIVTAPSRFTAIVGGRSAGASPTAAAGA
jgi:hypothetical protein